MSGQKVSPSLQEMMAQDRIQLILVPQKKGLIRRHVEYIVKSERFRSEVNRRYSDFQALHELLLARFPYRAVPKLPPAKILAIIAGVASDTIELRRKALSRWLTVVCFHPVIGRDQIIRFFLTENIPDNMGSILREQFRHLPDEFIQSDDGPKARDLATPGLRASVASYRIKIHGLLEVLIPLAQLIQRLCNRTVETGQDVGILCKEFSKLSNLEASSSSDWIKIKDDLYSASKQLAFIGRQMEEQGEREDEEVLQKVLLLADILQGYEDLCIRHDRGLVQDHKKGIEKIGLVKRRETKGILCTEISWRDDIEKKISENEIVLSDLESRQAFALLCLDEETRVCLGYFQLLAILIRSLRAVECEGFSELAKSWEKLFSEK